MIRLRDRIVDFLYRTATGAARTRRLLTPVFGGIFFCLVLATIFGAFFLDRLLGLPKFPTGIYAVVASCPFLAVGGWVWAWSGWRFFRTKGTPVPVNPPPVLVTDGPYACSRNPMMTGLILVMAGLGILLGSVSLAVVMTPLFALVCVLEFKYIEEPELEKRFGAAYKAYRAKTPRILPVFRPRLR
ncbi:MAG: hypothetical protein A4E73_01665 [Syntrophaceae bacterium PtaU1.Bin231]|nr:MAG: hypothetical protein A4E73_01665 [Syntrophaceae bacterium PtaU1.Bin231]HOG17901.1 isoprenylcysteine carboxylmethyltransferase family protein [Syntrophales bacterium]